MLAHASLALMSVLILSPVAQDPAEPPTDQTQVEAIATDAPPEGVIVLPLVGSEPCEVHENLLHEFETTMSSMDPGQIIVVGMDIPHTIGADNDEISRTIGRLAAEHEVVAWIQHLNPLSAFLSHQCDRVFVRDGCPEEESIHFSVKCLPPNAAARASWLAFEEQCKQITATRQWESFKFSYDFDDTTGFVSIAEGESGRHRIIRAFCGNTRFGLPYACFVEGFLAGETELAAALNLSEWREVSNVGRRLADEHRDRVSAASESILSSFSALRPPHETLAGLERQLEALERLEATVAIAPEVADFWNLDTNPSFYADKRREFKNKQSRLEGRQ